MSTNVLEPGEVGVWLSSVACPEACLVRYEQTLTPAELRRVNAFRFPHLRNAFLASRGALRELLAQYTGEKAHEIEIAYTKLGKPYLPNTSLQFNVSHSSECLAFVFAYKTRVGIDVEQIRPMEDLLHVSTQFFSPPEVTALRRAPVDSQPVLFFQTWTLKEAFLKATGEGLSCPLDSFAICLEPEPRLQLLGQNQSTQSWFLHSFVPASGYVGGLVSEQRPAAIHWRTFTHEL